MLLGNYIHKEILPRLPKIIAKNSGKYYFLKDQLGSIDKVVDDSGNVIQKYIYGAYGKLLCIIDSNNVDITTDPMVKPIFTYTSREYDIETGFIYLRKRFYSPEICRFTQEDPFPGHMGDPISLVNKYAYASNNPMKYTDPYGLFSFESEIQNAFNDISSTLTKAREDISSEAARIWQNNKREIVTAAVVAAGAAAIVYGGGVASSAGIGAIVSSIYEYKAGGDVDHILKAGLAGAISGAFVSSSIGYSVKFAALHGAGLGGSIAAGAAGGAVAGAASAQLTSQIVTGKWASGEDTLLGAFAGGVGGALAGGLIYSSGVNAVSQTTYRSSNILNDTNRAVTTSAGGINTDKTPLFGCPNFNCSATGQGL